MAPRGEIDDCVCVVGVEIDYDCEASSFSSHAPWFWPAAEVHHLLMIEWCWRVTIPVGVPVDHITRRHSRVYR